MTEQQAGSTPVPILLVGTQRQYLPPTVVANALQQGRLGLEMRRPETTHKISIETPLDM